MMNKMPCLLIACFVLSAAYAEEPAASESTKRADTIRYGIETQVIELLSTLKAEKSDEFKKEILEAFDASSSPKLKSAIFDYLGALKLADGEARAAEAIKSRDSNADDFVSSAFSYLATIESEAAIDEAVEILSSDEKRYLQAAIKAIGVSGSDAEAEALQKAYEAEGVEQATKEAIVLALGKMRSVASFDLLASIASSDESSKAIRMYACTALGDLGEERAVAVLAGASVSNDPNVRAAAVAALGNYATEAARSAVREGLRDAHVLPRIAAAKAAGRSRDGDSVPFLEYKASYDPEKAVREASIEALAEIGGGRVDEYLTAFMADSRNSTQYRSVALGAIVAKGGIEARAKALAAFVVAQAEKDRTLYTAFARAAMSVDDQNASPFAEVLLGDKEFSMRLGAIAWAERNRALSLKGTLQALSETDSNDAVKKRAARALERLAP
ncbi:MAG: hypothetical protein CVV47_04815 [Spirochaetae bacterium HGW-Spirochaetae-3]|jgi:HEAT repeat protein|nr:MAG: hypothetical protein CVV47_04815 [Spirochaetae bacterium HGW-Spirochaetae-3]